MDLKDVGEIGIKRDTDLELDVSSGMARDGDGFAQLVRHAALSDH
jgi:hypothetical protein